MALPIAGGRGAIYSVEAKMFIVFATLATLVALALLFKPHGFIGHWKRLADQFETARQPNRYSFLNENIYVGWLSEPRWFWFPWQRRAWQIDGGEYTFFDVECNEQGLWLRHKGDTKSKCPEHMLVPWPFVNVRKEYSNEIVFQVAADYLIDFRIRRELGDECVRHMRDSIRIAS